MKRPPGPKSLLGLGNVREFSEHTLTFLMGLREKYGETVHFRMGPFHAYVFYHPDQIKELLVTHWKDAPKLDRQVKVLEQWDGQGLLLSEGELWQRQHRLVQPAFAAKRFKGYADTMVAKTLKRVGEWKQRSQAAAIEIDEEMTGLAMEIITETLFGGEVSEKASEIGKAVAVLSVIAVDEMKRISIPPKWLPTKHNKDKAWAIQVLNDAIDGFIQTRRQSGEDRGDLLSMLLLAVDEEGNQGRMTDQQARDESMVLFLAGHDTTASALVWTWFLLGNHPDVEDKMRREVASVLGNRTATFEDVPKLKYVQQVIRESLRLYPPAIGTFARQATQEMTIGGYAIPKNSILYSFSYVTHRDARWFPEPEKFDPDRFSPEREKQIPPFAYFPFGAGPRVCIGMQFAMVEMTLVLATILQHCRLKPLPGQTATPDVRFTLRPKEKLYFEVRPN